jgi:outer membrane usher protein FimD/PapC
MVGGSNFSCEWITLQCALPGTSAYAGSPAQKNLMIRLNISTSSIDISVSWNWSDNYNKNDRVSQMVFAKRPA